MRCSRSQINWCWTLIAGILVSWCADIVLRSVVSPCRSCLCPESWQSWNLKESIYASQTQTRISAHRRRWHSSSRRLWWRAPAEWKPRQQCNAIFSPNNYVRPPYCWAEMHAGRVACCLLVIESRWVWRRDRQTERWMDARPLHYVFC